MATGHADTDMKMCYKEYSISHICSLNLASSIFLCISDESESYRESDAIFML